MKIHYNNRPSPVHRDKANKCFNPAIPVADRLNCYKVAMTVEARKKHNQTTVYRTVV